MVPASTGRRGLALAVALEVGLVPGPRGRGAAVGTEPEPELGRARLADRAGVDVDAPGVADDRRERAAGPDGQRVPRLGQILGGIGGAWPQVAVPVFVSRTVYVTSSPGVTRARHGDAEDHVPRVAVLEATWAERVITEGWGAAAAAAGSADRRLRAADAAVTTATATVTGTAPATGRAGGLICRLTLRGPDRFSWAVRSLPGGQTRRRPPPTRTRRRRPYPHSFWISAFW